MGRDSAGRNPQRFAASVTRRIEQDNIPMIQSAGIAFCPHHGPIRLQHDHAAVHETIFPAAIRKGTGTGKVGFISVDDIAVAALTASAALNADYVLTGPEALSYDDVAAIVSTTLGRPVRHIVLDPAQLADRFEA